MDLSKTCHRSTDAPHAGRGISRAVGRHIVLPVLIGMNRDIENERFVWPLRVITLRQDDEYRRIVRWNVLEQLVRATTSVRGQPGEAAAAHEQGRLRRRRCRSQRRKRSSAVLASSGSGWRGVLNSAETTGVRAEAAEVGRIVSAIARRAKASARRTRHERRCVRCGTGPGASAVVHDRRSDAMRPATKP